MTIPPRGTVGRFGGLDTLHVSIPSPVTLYTQTGFQGETRALSPGSVRFTDPSTFNDRAVSIQVAQGYCAVLFEDADDGGGYGRAVDLLEDCPDLSVYGFSGIASYVIVFSTTNGTLVYVRGQMQNGAYVAGHWERQRASGAGPAQPTSATVSPPYPPHADTTPTALSVAGAVTTISHLGPQQSFEVGLWNHAVNNQQGIIGNDFRGAEVIGTACFERASAAIYIPNNLNFWYPQARANDHRSTAYCKHTLAGKVKHVETANLNDQYVDYDVNIDVIPNPGFEYLTAESHPREYTDIMSAQWTLSAHQSGHPNCSAPDQIAEFSFVECEIQPYHDEKAIPAKLLNDAATARAGQDICLYGPWIYDKGHCCHPEIHPAEQIWWREAAGFGKKVYHCNVFVDASKRFWWRDQMDDGVKLKPWGAPPIKGLFAFAFEAQIGAAPVSFDLANVDFYNITEYPGAEQVYRLVYQGQTLVSFTPHNDAFKVSFENVGSDGGSKVRGFLVIETAVGTVTQKATKITVLQPGTVPIPTVITLAAGSAPEDVDQRYERQFFDKLDGHYMFTVTETDPLQRAPGVTDGRLSLATGRLTG